MKLIKILALPLAAVLSSGIMPGKTGLSENIGLIAGEVQKKENRKPYLKIVKERSLPVLYVCIPNYRNVKNASLFITKEDIFEKLISDGKMEGWVEAYRERDPNKLDLDYFDYLAPEGIRLDVEYNSGKEFTCQAK